MSSTKTKLSRHKQAKANKRKKANKAKAHRNNLARIKNRKLMEDKKMASDLARHGVVEMAEKLSKMKGGDKEIELTNKDVMTGIMDLVNMVGPLHGAVEVLTILEYENKVELTEEHKETIVEFDKATVKLTEDIDVIVTLIESGQTPEDYLELLVDHVNSSAVLVEETLPAINEGVFADDNTKKLIDIYATEHKIDTESNQEFGLRLHNLRMERVFKEYKTELKPEQDINVIEDSKESDLSPTEC